VSAQVWLRRLLALSSQVRPVCRHARHASVCHRTCAGAMKGMKGMPKGGKGGRGGPQVNMDPAQMVRPDSLCFFSMS
jgi:hypothetical protein